MTLKLWQADTDLHKGHPILQGRWPVYKQAAKAKGIILLEWEVYRPDVRQQWLYGAGRTAEQLQQKGINPGWARPTEPVVTNAWSAATSAHGHMEDGQPAACAIDVVPVGADGHPWTEDDPWQSFVELDATVGQNIGLVHFHAPGKAVWDRPHLQLFPEWDDVTHTLRFPRSS